MPYQDAVDMAEMLVALGRAVPPQAWVETLVIRRRHEQTKGLPHNMT